MKALVMSSVPDDLQRDVSLDTFRSNLLGRLRDIGIPGLHGQHTQLVEIMVVLYAQMRRLQKKAPDPQDLDALREAILALKRYAIQHFHDEEGFMETLRFPDLHAHRQAHQVFIQSLLTLEQRIWQESVSYIVDLMHLVIGWLFQHINQMDMAYARFARGERVALSSTELHLPPALRRDDAHGPQADAEARSQVAMRETMLRHLIATGIAEIDQEHVDLMNIVVGIRLLAGRLSTHKPTPLDWSGIDHAIAFLLTYCRDHFAGEEAWMRKIGYPKLAAHIQEHQGLLTRVKALVNQLVCDRSIGLIVDLHFFLYEWFLSHTVRSDGLFVEFASSQKRL
ncbi:MAG: hemerythrin domain-containing protein [Magnetococcales bacterium]|nr:hemerythrin domain-containing protein [Magnetococcales bacterium]